MSSQMENVSHKHFFLTGFLQPNWSTQGMGDEINMQEVESL
jgi:hypothetical protein